MPTRSNNRSRTDRRWPLPVQPLGFAFIFCLTSLIQAQPNADLIRSANEVLAKVCQLRQLEAKATVLTGVKTREQIKAYLIERLDKEYLPDQMALEQKVLIKLGLIPEDLVLRDFVLELLTEQVAGYYDPYSHTFYLADWIPVDIQKPIMAHELTHALQDQYFDLSLFLERIEGNDDATLAQNAVIEGESVAIMLDYILQAEGGSFLEIPDVLELNRRHAQILKSQFQVFASAPEYLRESLLFPYTYGTNFIQVFRHEHPWEKMVELYSNLPQSSEQIMHPKKYMHHRDEPTFIPDEQLPQPMPGAWERVYVNVLGEFTTYQTLKQFIEEETARRGSQGWGGDRVELYRSTDGRISLVLHSIWDTGQDAQEFFRAYCTLIENKYPSAKAVVKDPPDPNARVWESERDWISVKMQSSRRVQSIEVEVKRGRIIELAPLLP